MKDKNYAPGEARDAEVIDEMATLRVELIVKPGRIPGLNQGLALSTTVPLNILLSEPLWPQFERAVRQAFESFGLRVIDPASRPMRGRRN